MQNESKTFHTVLLPNYAEENVVKGESVPNFKINTSKGASSDPARSKIETI